MVEKGDGKELRRKMSHRCSGPGGGLTLITQCLNGQRFDKRGIPKPTEV